MRHISTGYNAVSLRQNMHCADKASVVRIATHENIAAWQVCRSPDVQAGLEDMFTLHSRTLRPEHASAHAAQPLARAGRREGAVTGHHDAPAACTFRRQIRRTHHLRPSSSTSNAIANGPIAAQCTSAIGAVPNIALPNGV